MMALEERQAFTVPPELEAHEPPEARGLARDEVRLLVTPRTGEVRHARLTDLPRFLKEGDLLVVNTSRTLAAALKARRGDGSVIDFHLSNALPGGLWLVGPRKSEACQGEVLSLPGLAKATLAVHYGKSPGHWIPQLRPP